jgi:hypothetical protein
LAGADVHFEPSAQIDRGNDLPTQVHQAGDDIRGQRDLRQFHVAHDLLNFLELDAEQQFVQIECAELSSL